MLFVLLALSVAWWPSLVLQCLALLVLGAGAAQKTRRTNVTNIRLQYLRHLVGRELAVLGVKLGDSSKVLADELAGRAGEIHTGMLLGKN